MAEQVMVVSSAIPFEEEVYLNGLKDRKIIINQEIDDSIVERAIMQIINWNEEDRDIPVEDRKEIKLYINSPGGSVDVGTVLANTILTSKTPIHGIVLARAYSMGAIILIACHKRSMYDGSSCLLHGGQIGIHDTNKRVRSTLSFYSKMDDKINNIIVARTKIERELLEKKFESDEEWYMTSDEALQYGLVDEIIG